MKLFEAIVEANHRALRGSQDAGIRISEHGDSLPVVSLTCIDPRLEPLMPEVLGIPSELFVWLRNAGNIITNPLSSTMRSRALACAVKGGKEIALIGHSDCKVRQTTAMALTDAFERLGVDRSRLPENLTEYFGLFASERQNVIKGCEIVRSSPLIGSKVPVHGLLVDIKTGLLEWLVNGYQSRGAPVPTVGDTQHIPIGGTALESLIAKATAKIGDIELGSMKIGEIARTVEPFVEELAKTAQKQPQRPPPTPPQRQERKSEGRKGKPTVLRPLK